MENETSHWTKTELEIYLLLLCANADSVKTEKEMDTIKNRFDESTFEDVYKEFLNDSEDEGLKKVENNVCYHEYSFKELEEIRVEMKRVFYSDDNYNLMERRLEQILNRILY